MACTWDSALNTRGPKIQNFPLGVDKHKRLCIMFDFHGFEKLGICGIGTFVQLSVYGIVLGILRQRYCVYLKVLSPSCQASI